MAATENLTTSFSYYVDPDDGWTVFTCWNAEHTGCGVHSVPPEDRDAEIAALERTRINRTARNEQFDFQKREWVPAPTQA